MAGKKEIIILLESIADLLEYKGENPFKVNAFRNGANAIKSSEIEFEIILKEKALDKIKGIGKSLQSVIYEFYETGSSSVYSELKIGVPDGINELLKIRELGSKKVKVLYNELGISNVDELESACKDNRLASLKGFGEAAQNKIASEIEKRKAYSKYILLNIADSLSEKILEKISKFETIIK